MICLRRITPENLDEILELSVAENQREFVSTPAESLARAWTSPETAFPFGIYEGNTAVGFLMLGYWVEKDQYTLWKFLIDSRYQRRGYGRGALKQALRYAEESLHANALYLGVRHGNHAARELYRSVGFRETGLTTDTAFEMKLDMKKAPC